MGRDGRDGRRGPGRPGGAECDGVALREPVGRRRVGGEPLHGYGVPPGVLPEIPLVPSLFPTDGTGEIPSTHGRIAPQRAAGRIGQSRARPTVTIRDLTPMGATSPSRFTTPFGAVSVATRAQVDASPAWRAAF